MYYSEKKIFTHASVDHEGDPTVGIPGARLNVDGVLIDLSSYEEKDRSKVIREALESLLDLGKALLGDDFPLLARLDSGLGSWVLTSIAREQGDSEPIWFKNVSKEEEDDPPLLVEALFIRPVGEPGAAWKRVDESFDPDSIAFAIHEVWDQGSTQVSFDGKDFVIVAFGDLPENARIENF